MGVMWTEDQRKVIDLRDRNILVSAAAGSERVAGSGTGNCADAIRLGRI